MRFKAKKVYGESKLPYCYFCGKIATRKNDNGLEVCYLHTKAVMEEIKCTCGSWLEQRSGKFGAYFNCANCGNINLAKVAEMKAIMKQKEGNVTTTNTNLVSTPSFTPPKKIEPKERKEIVISSRDAEYFD